MSLFSRITPKDNNTSAAPSGSSLFGSATTSAPSGGSLFGAAPTNTAAPSGGSLFGAAPSSTTAPSGGSLFGAAPSNNAPPSGSSLFGAKPAATSSLFASTTNQQPQQQQSQGQAGGNASVFGDNILPSSKVPEPGAIEHALDPTALPSQPAYFRALLEKNKKRPSEDNAGAFGPLPQLQLGLNDISRKVRNLGQGSPSAGLVRGSGGDGGRSQSLLAASGVNTSRTLRDIEELAASTAARPQTLLEQAEYGTSTSVKDSLAAYHQTNFEKMWQDNVRKAQLDFDKMIDEQLHDVDWHAHRQRIFEHFGLKTPQNHEDTSAEDTTMRESGGFGRSSRRKGPNGASTLGQSFGLPGMSKSVIGVPGMKGARQSVFGDVAEKLPADGLPTATQDRVQRRKQDQYGERVKDLNVARIQESSLPIMHFFSEVEAQPSNDDTSMLVNAYNALAEITRENSPNGLNSVKERQYARDYLDDTPGAKGHITIRKQILNGSRKFLEQQFYDQLETTVSRNPREAQIGGTPSAAAKVKGYVRVRAARKELGPDPENLQQIQDDYCWAVMFYMLRSGLYQEALGYVEENQAAFRQIDRSFARYLRAFVGSKEHRLPPDMQTHINNEFSQRQRLAPEDSIDPYRMICYKVIGRCDLNRRSLDNITNDMMDWTWLQFSMAREYSRVDEFAHEAFGLDELRQSIKDVGERYFAAGSDIVNAPTTLFFLQILAGMFEKAIADLYPHNYISATHFAIALDFYGLLRVSDIMSSEDLLTYTTRQQPQIAFGSMVGLYTRDFRTANSTNAVDYLTLICLNSDLTGELGKSQRELCYQALIELTLETREFAQLLGDIRSDGQRIKGAIEQRLKLIKLDDEQEFLRNITLVAARTANEQSRVTDAALLFHLAEDYDKVIEVVNDAVSLALTVELGDQPARITPLKPRVQDQAQGAAQPQSSLSLTAVDDPVDLARNMTSLYGTNAMYYDKIRITNREVCSVLLKLADARKALEASRWPQVIDHVNSARILPIEAAGNLSAIRAAAQTFNEMPPVLARTIAHVMLWTVVACSNQVDKLRRQEYDAGTMQSAIDMFVQQAKDVMMFAGLIRYRLPGRTWEALARAGQELGAY